MLSNFASNFSNEFWAILYAFEIKTRLKINFSAWPRAKFTKKIFFLLCEFTFYYEFVVYREVISRNVIHAMLWFHAILWIHVMSLKSCYGMNHAEQWTIIKIHGKEWISSWYIMIFTVLICMVSSNLRSMS